MNDEEHEAYILKNYKRNVMALLLSWVIWLPLQAATNPYFQLYAKALGATPIILSIISFVSSITIGFSRIIGGYIADKYGRKKILVYMTFVASLSFLLYSYAPDWEWLLLGTFISSLALLYQPAVWGIMADSAPKKNRGKLFALYNVVPGVLMAVSPIFAIYLISRYSLVPAMRLIYFLIFAFGVVVTIIRGILLKETLNREKSLNELKAGFWDAYRKALVFIRARVFYLLIVYVMVNIAISMSFLIPYYAVFYLNLTEMEWGIIWVAGGVIALFISLPSGFIIDKIGRRPTIIFTLVMYFTGFILYFISPVLPYPTFQVILIAETSRQIGQGVFFVVFNTLSADLVPVEFRGRVNSVMRMISDVTGSFIALLAGFIYSAIGAPIPFVISAIIILSGGLVALTKISETK
ncbi:MAG: MFS transporter [Candidatus Odinarchaeota archaeon]|nr:MFS transporter [Candidatus Odinarchaeota archaeon]